MKVLVFIIFLLAGLQGFAQSNESNEPNCKKHNCVFYKGENYILVNKLGRKPLLERGKNKISDPVEISIAITTTVSSYGPDGLINQSLRSVSKYEKALKELGSDHYSMYEGYMNGPERRRKASLRKNTAEKNVASSSTVPTPRLKPSTVEMKIYNAQVMLQNPERVWTYNKESKEYELKECVFKKFEATSDRKYARGLKCLKFDKDKKGTERVLSTYTTQGDNLYRVKPGRLNTVNVYNRNGQLEHVLGEGDIINQKGSEVYTTKLPSGENDPAKKICVETKNGKCISYADNKLLEPIGNTDLNKTKIYPKTRTGEPISLFAEPGKSFRDCETEINKSNSTTCNKTSIAWVASGDKRDEMHVLDSVWVNDYVAPGTSEPQKRLFYFTEVTDLESGTKKRGFVNSSDVSHKAYKRAEIDYSDPSFKIGCDSHGANHCGPKFNSLSGVGETCDIKGMSVIDEALPVYDHVGECVTDKVKGYEIGLLNKNKQIASKNDSPKLNYLIESSSRNKPGVKPKLVKNAFATVYRDKYWKNRTIPQLPKINHHKLTKEQLFAIDSLARTTYGEMRGQTYNDRNEPTFSYPATVLRVLLNRAKPENDYGSKRCDNFLVPKADAKNSGLEFLGAPKEPICKGFSRENMLAHVGGASMQFSAWNKGEANLDDVLCPQRNSKAWKAIVALATQAVLNPESIYVMTDNVPSESYHYLSLASNPRPAWKAAATPVTAVVDGSELEPKFLQLYSKVDPITRR